MKKDPSSELKAYLGAIRDPEEQLKYVLTSLATAVQERISEDIILMPRESGSPDSKNSASVYTQIFTHAGKRVRQHLIFYQAPDMRKSSTRELLRITLHVAHELGHLLLDGSPGKILTRAGIPEDKHKDIREVEADWFALCALQIYGFVYPPDHALSDS